MSNPTVMPRLSLEEQVGQVIMGIWTGDLERLAGLVAQGCVGGLFLPPGSAPAPRAMAETLNRLQRLSTYPLLCAADLRMGPGPRVPSELALGAARQPDLARRSGMMAGKLARAMGIHLVLSPSLDVWHEAGQAPWPLRTFGETPSLVILLGTAFIEGCHAAGALAAGSRFPGCGAALYDTERRLAVLPQDRQTMERIDLLPYVEAGRAGLRVVMSAHVHVSALDSLPNRLATHSSAVASRLLRRTLGFDGLLLSDNLDAAEVNARYTPGQAAILAFAAGHDLLLTANPEQVYRALYEVLLHGDIPLARLQEAVSRIWAAKAWLGLADERFVTPPADHWEQETALARQVARAALTAIRGQPSLVPWRHPLVLSNRVSRPDGRPLEADLARLAADQFPQATCRTLDPQPGAAQIDGALAAAGNVDAALLFLEIKPGDPGDVGDAMAALAQAGKRIGLPVAVVVVGNPAPLIRFSGADLLIYTPSDALPDLEAAFSYVNGQFAASGRLPISVPGLEP